MYKKLISCFGILVFLLCGEFFVTKTFAQCGNYFKTNYRAANRIYNVNNRRFGLEDWTGDGKSDFWNLQPDGSTSKVIIFPSRPSGYWDWDNPIFLATPLPAGANGIFIVKDFNGDGNTDLWAEILGSVTIYRNNGSGALTAQTPFMFPPEFQASYGYHDLNGDGLLDWVNMVNVPQQGSSLGYQLGQTNGTFGARANIITGQTVGAGTKAIGDFNGDGKIDMVFTYGTSGGFVYRLAKNLDGVNFEVGSPAVYGPAFPTRFQAVRDFNNDGRMDILATAYNWSSSPPVRKLFILYGQTNDSFTTTEYPVANSEETYETAAAEFSGDNQPDIIEVSQKHYSVYKNNGGGSFARTDYQRRLVNGKFEDFSGDGKADLYYYSTSYPTINTFNEEVIVIKENVCEPFGETKRANFALDAVGDLVIWNPSSGNWRSFSPDLGFHGHNATTATFNWGTMGDVAAPGDFDADGITDYAVYRNSTGEWWIRLSSNGGWSVVGFGLPGDIAVPNDYDGGGKTDIAVFRPSDGVWYIRFTETQSFGAAQFGANGDKLVPQDYDGDGKTDLAVFRPSTGMWFYLRSSDLSYGAVNWGLSTDKPVPADYDGDGRADIAVFRDGVWYILRSMNNSIHYVHWGWAGDLPMPLYQNGEFADMVVYRPANAGWYNRRSPFSPLAFGQESYSPIYFGLPNN